MYLLIVCGLKGQWDKSPANPAIFNDFFGTIKLFQYLYPECKGTFLSCFNSMAYFEALRQGSPPFVQSHTTIKFGQAGSEQKTLSEIDLTKIKDLRGVPYEEVPLKDEPVGASSQMLHPTSRIPTSGLWRRIMEWFGQTAALARPRDIVDVLIFTHGERTGLVEIGAEWVHYDQWLDLRERFKPGVQVNMVTSACYGGHLVDSMLARNVESSFAESAVSRSQLHWSYLKRTPSNRIRNFVFAEAWVMSLCQVTLPGYPEKATEEAMKRTLQEHNRHMRDRMKGHQVRQGSAQHNHDDQSVLILPGQSSLSPAEIARQAAELRLEQLLLVKMHNISHDPNEISRRRRSEHPQAQYGLWNELWQAEGGMIPESASTLVAMYASAAVNQNEPILQSWEDGGVVHELWNWIRGGKLPIGDFIQLLYWRGRYESALYDVFMLLYSTGLLDGRRCFSAGIQYSAINNNVMALLQYLLCFSLAEEGKGLRNVEMWTETTAPLVWLATMIIRGGSDHHSIMRTIVDSGLLGSVDTSAWNARLTRANSHWDFDVTAQATSRSEIRFGHWLPVGPQNFSDDDEEFTEQIVNLFRSAEEKFNEIEAVFKEMGRIPDEHLRTEHQQTEFLAPRQHRQRDFKYSGLWQPTASSPPSSPPSSPVYKRRMVEGEPLIDPFDSSATRRPVSYAGTTTSGLELPSIADRTCEPASSPVTSSQTVSSSPPASPGPSQQPSRGTRGSSRGGPSRGSNRGPSQRGPGTSSQRGAGSQRGSRGSQSSRGSRGSNAPRG